MSLLLLLLMIMMGFFYSRGRLMATKHLLNKTICRSSVERDIFIHSKSYEKNKK